MKNLVMVLVAVAAVSFWSAAKWSGKPIEIGGLSIHPKNSPATSSF